MLVSATRLGRLLFALSFAVLGVFNLIRADFTIIWQPVPQRLPWRGTLAYAAGALLIACGLGMLLTRTMRLATLLLTANLLAWLLLRTLPGVLAAPGVEMQWLALGTTTMMFTAGWILLAAIAREQGGGHGLLDGPEAVRSARRLYGAALPLVGLSHFFYLQLTAHMVPRSRRSRCRRRAVIGSANGEERAMPQGQFPGFLML